MPVSYVLREQVEYVAGRVDYLCHVDRDEVRFKLEHRELGSVENFVAKTFYILPREVDITTCMQA